MRYACLLDFGFRSCDRVWVCARFLRVTRDFIESTHVSVFDIFQERKLEISLSPVALFIKNKTLFLMRDCDKSNN